MLWAIKPGWGVCVGGVPSRGPGMRRSGIHAPQGDNASTSLITSLLLDPFSLASQCDVSLSLFELLCALSALEFYPLKRHRCQRQKRAGAANRPSPSFYREKPGAETTFFTPLPQPLDVMTAATRERPSRGSPDLCSFSQQNVPGNLKTLLLFKCITLNLL